jgi:malonate transporter and related proteins
MGAVTAALGTMAAIAVVGWLLGRSRLLGPGAEQVIARVVFTIAAPSLLLVTIAHADLHLLLSRVAVVTALSTAAVALASALVLRWLWRRSSGEATVGVLAASYVNAGNLGIPIAVYVLGDAVAVVPTLLFQLLVLAPIAFLVLESRPGAASPTAGATPPPAGTSSAAPGAAPPAASGTGPRAVAGRTLRNPIIVGALTGLVLAALPWDLPEVVYEPFRLIGAAAAPLALIAFGMSLVVPPVPDGDARPSRLTRNLTLAVAMRSLVHPALAFGIGAALGLEGTAMLAVVTMAALPTAQNVLVYALQYGRGQAVARDAGVVTTFLALPVMLVIAATLG